MIHYWDHEKNNMLKANRKISFERIMLAIEQGGLIDILEHSNPKKYDGQKLYVIIIESYCWVVPFKDDKTLSKRKLITAFPSRKLTKRYLL